MRLNAYRFTAMGTPCELKIVGSKRAANEIALRCQQEAQRFEARYSRFIATSIVSQINAAAGKIAVPVDEECAAILEYADICWSLSDGLFDLTSGVLRRVWHRHRSAVPTREEVEACLALIGWQKVRRTQEGVLLTQPGMELDLGGVVKEYAADAIAQLIKDAGFDSAVVNLGGDIYCLGLSPEGVPWRIGIVNPLAEGPLAEAPLVNRGVATSGGYERYRVIEGKRYSHLLNPHTGFPVKSLMSVSVMAETVVAAGSIATIAMLKEEASGLAWLASSGSVYVAMTQQGDTIVGNPE
ncbi:MAG: FAD:protein FMN transferase [Proteobacteria bacterium]|nr:FAD:protein FMN transferase [Pseudomonadota bacterium]MDA0958338.1 FAD:protein FMN transferase [Pseudomonadota bacterium]MDA1207716.1 FAD:protein FMN transferase [Pseudomonadota bacterium]